MTLQLLRAAQHRRMVWKNGGGETTEIAVWPPGAGLDDFEWRISMARVASDGPFSRFAGVERTLTLLSGDGLRLLIGDAAPVDLRVGDAPLSFAADMPTTATLHGGAVTDLNVMSRRGVWRHRVTRWRLDEGRVECPGEARFRVCLCQLGRIRVETAAGVAELGPLDAVLGVDTGASTWALRAGGAADGLLVEFGA